MAQKSTTDLALVLLGLFAWALAAVFGSGLVTTEVDGVNAAGHKVAIRAANPAAAGAAGGFAIAGGMCFVGAAFAARDSRRSPGPVAAGPVSGGPP
jgi:hypothetical protein